MQRPTTSTTARSPLRLATGLRVALLPFALACAHAEPVAPGSTTEPIAVEARDESAAAATATGASAIDAASPAPLPVALPAPLPGRAATATPLAPSGTWTGRMKAGRAALRGKDVALAEENFTAAWGFANVFRDGDPRVDATVNNLQRVARAYLDALRAGDFERVMEFLGDISAARPETRTRELAYLFDRLAATLAAAGRHAAARESLERALMLEGGRSPESDPSLVPIHARLGITYLELGDENLGRHHTQLALEIAATSEGVDGPLYGQALVAKAQVEHRAGNDAQAEADLRAALAIHVAHYGAASPGVAAVTRELAALYLAEGRDEDARTQYLRVISIWDEMPSERFQQALARNDLAWILVEAGNGADAQRYAHEALDLLEGLSIEGQPLASVADTLATALRDQKEYAEAETFYLRALAEGAKGDALPGFSPAAIAARYATLLDATGRGAEADALRARTREGQSEGHSEGQSEEQSEGQSEDP